MQISFDDVIVQKYARGDNKQENSINFSDIISLLELRSKYI